MVLSATEHRSVQTASKANRAARRRDARAAGGPTYRKVPVRVAVIDVPGETDPTTGETLRLATSDVPVERGRYFRIWREAGKWKCRCATNGALGSCHHVGYLQALDAGELDEDGADG